MKNTILFTLFIAILSLFMAGCPVSSSYPLGEHGKEKIDKAILGTWNCASPDAEVVNLKIEKKDDYTYAVNVLEKGAMYAEEVVLFDGWITTLEGTKFLVLKVIDPGKDDTYYVYHYKVNSKKEITTHDISLLVNGTDAITSIENYRKEVTASMKMDNFYTSELIWKKQ